jgi:DNA repair photolyase
MAVAAPQYVQQGIFPDALTKRPALPILDDQTDIRYIGTFAKTVINRPEATGMEFWSINPYIGCALGCAYCYARYAHGYAFERAAAAHPDRTEIARDQQEMIPWLAFERRILVKQNAAEALRKTLRQGSERHAGLMKGESISIGTATDPYQPAERRFRITRSILEVLAEHPGLRVRIITKSPLVSRDVDVMKRILRHSSIHIHMSLITVDRDLARRIEPRAPTPEARLRAVKRLRDAGIDVGINVMPILPGITDAPEQLDALVAQIAASGATHIAACALRLQSAARKRYMPFIAEQFPHLAARYAATYRRDFRTGDSYREGLTRVMARICERHGVPYGTYDDGSLPDAWAEQEVGGDALNQLDLPFAPITTEASDPSAVKRESAGYASHAPAMERRGATPGAPR